MTPSGVPRIRHAFTVDLEDWYQGIPISPERRARAERRLEPSADRLLALLADRGVKATFFVLGPAALDHPELIRRIAADGHEIGSHGWSHDLLYRLTPERLREETKRAVGAVGEITGKAVTAYRAAYFSITAESLWALEVLASLGFRCDSSVFPVRNWRYGIPDFDSRPKRIETGAGPIYEIPLSVREVFGARLPVSGGAYFRLYPYAITRQNFRVCEREGRPAVFYLHPWELDPGHPRVSFHWKAWLTHYANLRSTEAKLTRLLADFRFASLADILDDELARSRS